MGTDGASEEAGALPLDRRGLSITSVGTANFSSSEVRAFQDIRNCWKRLGTQRTAKIVHEHHTKKFCKNLRVFSVEKITSPFLTFVSGCSQFLFPR